MVFIRRRGLQNLNRGLPACPTMNILKVFNISYIVIVFTLLCNGAKRCGVWLVSDFGRGFWDVHLASGCSILPVDSERVCHTLQVLWYSLSFGSCSRSSGIPFHSRGYCVCTWIVEVVVILFVVQLREALDVWFWQRILRSAFMFRMEVTARWKLFLYKCIKQFVD